MRRDHGYVKPIKKMCLDPFQILSEDGAVENLAQIETWRQRDVDARTYIYSTIKPEQQAALHGCTTAFEMWSRITTEYAEIAAESEHLLWGKFYAYKFQAGNIYLKRKKKTLMINHYYLVDQSVMGFIAGVEQIAAQLRDAGAVVDEAQVIAKVLVSLPPSYRHFGSAWDSVRPEEKNLKLLTTRLVKEEKTNKMYNDGKLDPVDAAFFTGRQQTLKTKTHENAEETINNHALSSRGYRGGYPGLRGNYRGRGEYRGRGGYGSRGGYGNRGGYEHRGRGGHGNRRGFFHPYHQEGTYENYKSDVICWHCGGFGHTRVKCRKYLREQEVQDNNNYSQGDDQQQSISYKSTSDFTSRQSTDWFADSGATQHMTDQRDLLTNFIPVGSERWTVSGIGNTNLPVTGQGDVTLTAYVDGKSLKGMYGLTNRDRQMIIYQELFHRNP